MFGTALEGSLSFVVGIVVTSPQSTYVTSTVSPIESG